MRISLLRTSTAAAAAALLLGGLSACGADAKDDPETKPSSSSTPAGGEESSDADGGGSDGAAAPAAGTSLSKAEISDLLKQSSSSMTTARMHLEMEMNAGGQNMKVTADGDLQSDPLAQSMTMDMAGATMEMRMIGDAFYMKAPGMGAGDKWMRMRMSDLGALGMGSLEGMTDPMAMAEQASKYLQDAKYVGEEDVDGTSTKHYQMTVDVAGLLKEMDVPSAPAMEMPKSATQDIWVDDEGRVVKMVQDMSPLQMTTVTMSDFGKKVDITAPPENQVTDMKDAGLGGMAG